MARHHLHEALWLVEELVRKGNEHPITCGQPLWHEQVVPRLPQHGWRCPRATACASSARLAACPRGAWRRWWRRWWRAGGGSSGGGGSGGNSAAATSHPRGGVADAVPRVVAREALASGTRAVQRVDAASGRSRRRVARELAEIGIATCPLALRAARRAVVVLRVVCRKHTAHKGFGPRPRREVSVPGNKTTRAGAPSYAQTLRPHDRSGGAGATAAAPCAYWAARRNGRQEASTCRPGSPRPVECQTRGCARVAWWRKECVCEGGGGVAAVLGGGAGGRGSSFTVTRKSRGSTDGKRSQYTGRSRSGATRRCACGAVTGRQKRSSFRLGGLRSACCASQAKSVVVPAFVPEKQSRGSKVSSASRAGLEMA